jgi:kynurenine formamidase
MNTNALLDLTKVQLIDLTHSLTADAPTWDLTCGFHCNITTDYADSTIPVKFRVQQLTLPAGTGTHMDAPAHCFSGATTISDIPLNQLILPCVRIDVSQHADENYVISVADIEHFEHQYGAVPKHSLVIFYTGWDRFWDQPEQYRNNLQFPSVSAAAAELLLTREITGLGIDTLSPDCGHSQFPVHRLLLGANKYIIENVANAAQLSPNGAYAIALPIKLAEGTEAPIRLVGLTPL